MTPKAFSYLRFSTPEQAKGDSLRRQTALAGEWAIKNGMELDEELTMQDLGVSAFRGDNTKRGALSLFRRAVEDGLVPQGSVLLVENLDRISRQSPWDALPIFQSIINEGVDIVSLADGKRWSKEDLRDNPYRIMESLLVFIRANEESKTKSKRLAAAWSNKRRNAAEGQIITTRIPAWLEVSEKQGMKQFKLIQDRAKIVRLVFRLAKKGEGQHAIAQKLNEEGAPTFGSSEFWQRSYIAKLLSNEAVIGTYTPNVIEHMDGKKVRVKQNPIKEYFPAVVSFEVFNSVQAIASHRPRGKAKSGVVRNMLAGLAVCALCGSSMTRVNKGPNGGRPKLVCTKAKAGAGCKYHSVSLQVVESELRRQRDRLVGEAPKAVDHSNEIERLEVLLDELKEQTENLAQAIAEKPSTALRARLEQTEIEAEVTQQQLQTLTQQELQGRPKQLRVNLEKLEDALSKPEATLINTALRSVVGSIVVSPVYHSLTFNWKHGGSSSLSFDLSGGFEEELKE
jgi:DNA invertase Pin-like site-specific DNA recombinase